MNSKSLVSISDIGRDEIMSLLDSARRFEENPNRRLLEGRVVATLFFEPSTRTRLSFETAVNRLGGRVIGFSDANTTSSSKGETLKDTIKMVSNYVDIIIMRHYLEGAARYASEVTDIPVINGLTDFCHPCQVLADLMTVREHKGRLEGLKLCYIGDGNNMANSLIVGGLKCGMSVSIACPTDYQPDQTILDFAKDYPGKFLCTPDVLEAAKDSDVLYTDVWASMGQEEEAKARQAVFAGYQINDAVMAAAHPGAMVLHCLPAHRGEEITAEVFEAHAEEVFDEAENRLHAQKAVMYLLMK